MTRFLIDSDAYLAIRSLGLLAEICPKLPKGEPLLMVGHAARVELNPLQREISALEASGHVFVHAVLAKSPAGQRAKELRKSGVDKGEAEAIAWCVETHAVDDRPVFVSVDTNARKHAGAHQIVAVDMMGALVEWVEDGILTRSRAAELVVVWDDRAQERGRPSDYDTFDRTYAHRLAVRNARRGK